VQHKPPRPPYRPRAVLCTECCEPELYCTLFDGHRVCAACGVVEETMGEVEYMTIEADVLRDWLGCRDRPVFGGVS